MVRVISVHHFTGQHVQTVEQPTATAIAPPHRLLLALSSHCIEVRDLNNEGDVLFTFPTVDEVTQLVHCLNGDYVATIETKYNHQNRDINFVRVYVNWDSVATLQQSKMTSSGVSLGSSECGMVQPMRARIAGRVTPTTNQSELGSLEMIEIPTKANPNLIECCQVSGNIIISSGRTLTIYTFKVKTHDISKLRFIDFEESPMAVELSFVPKQIAMCENYVACINSDSMHMFKITARGAAKDDGHDDGSYGKDDDFTFKYVHPDAKVDYKQLLHDERTNPTKNPITVHLPTIVKSNSAIHKHSPFTFSDKEMNAKIQATSPTPVDVSTFQIHNLIQLKLVPIMIENAQRQVAEQFKCMVLKPLYVDQTYKRNNKSTGNRNDDKTMQSEYRNCLNSVVCMIATQQEGYLYQFDDLDAPNVTDNCISMYPFTAPVHKILIEDSFMHALTDAGLETYTLRIGHQLCVGLESPDNINTTCPPVGDSICLVGLRPFLGIEKILLSQTNLVLLANADSSPTHSVSSNSSSNASFWTLYNLELPSPKAIFNDVSIVANVHRFTSAQTYCHLMSEAHVILRTNLLLLKWKTTEGNVTLISPTKACDDDLIETYRTSCALLADHFIMCSSDDYVLAVPYYKMARLSPLEVLKRVKKLQEQSNNHSVKGLLHYVKKILLETKQPSANADRNFGASSKQHFAEAILELFEKHNYRELPKLILKSNILREYSTEKLINILDGQSSEEEFLTEKTLALSVLYVQRCNMKKARTLIEQIKTQELFDILLENWELLFETTTNIQSKHKNTTFSDLAQILMTTSTDVLSELLVTLMFDKKIFTLNKLLKVFLEYLPASIGGSDANTASVVLQKTLEIYFKRYFNKNENADLKTATYDRSVQEALKLLVRSYLSQLQILQLKEKNSTDNNTNSCNDDTKKTPERNEDDDKDAQQEKFKYNQTNKTYFEETTKKSPVEDYLFSHLRCEYLNKMPPFQVEITSKFYETCVKDYEKKECFRGNDEADSVLKKLQALLCSDVLPKQVVGEINAFLNFDDGGLRGNDSLRSIVMGTNEAVLFLVDVCPQCLLQYGKDRFTKLEEWKFLVATIQQRIILLSQNDDLKRICFFYKKILKDVLSHVATTMNLEHLVQVFPQRLNTDVDDYLNHQNVQNVSDEKVATNTDILEEIQNYEPYVVMCKETMHANQIKKLITATGQQLLCTLNL